MNLLKSVFKKIGPFSLITIAFASVILLGSLLLYLPVSSADGTGISYLDALFTSCSAVCVTGLVVQNTATFWSSFGKGVIIVLIQIGGLGVITVLIAVALMSGRRIGLRERNVMQNAVNAPKIGGIVKFTRFLLALTFLTELAGGLLLIPVFLPRYGSAGIAKAFFHSISAFCNAGFDLLGDRTAFVSLVDYHDNIRLNLVIMALIVIGGLGFLTWEDLFHKRFRMRKMALQTKLILATSAALILFPALYFFFFEFQGHALRDRALLSLFQSVTTRTAGFNTADLAAMSDRSILVMIFLMLIGGSPGSTAGGLKTTTFVVVMAAFVKYLRREKWVSLFGRTVPADTIRDAFALVMLYICLFLGGSLAISTIEQLPILDCMFECASAVGTVGLTLGVTPSLSNISKLILITFMYFGRLGGLTLAYAALEGLKPVMGKKPEEKVMIG